MCQCLQLLKESVLVQSVARLLTRLDHASGMFPLTDCYILLLSLMFDLYAPLVRDTRMCNDVTLALVLCRSFVAFSVFCFRWWSAWSTGWIEHVCVEVKCTCLAWRCMQVCVGGMKCSCWCGDEMDICPEFRAVRESAWTENPR